MSAYVSFLLNISSVLGSHDECNMEVFLHRVGVQLEGWEASEETKLLAGCRPYSECSSYNQTHCISLRFNLVSAHSSVSSDACCVSSVRPFKKSPLYCTWIQCNETKQLHLFGNILANSRQHLKPLNTQYESRVYCLWVRQPLISLFKLPVYI